MLSKRNADALLVLCVQAIIAGTALFLLFPVIVTVSMAFDGRDFMGPFPPPSLSMKWFGRLFDDAYLWSGFQTSLLLAIATAFLATAIGTSAAVAISRMPPRSRDVTTTIFLSPLVIPGVIIGFALLIFFSVFDLIPTFAKLLAAHLIIALPYTIRMTLIGLTGISETLGEAALSLGANARQTFFTITLPLAKSGISAGAIFAFAFSMEDVAISIFLSDYNTYTLPVALVSLMRSKLDLTIAAAAVVLMGLTLALLVVLDRVVGLERAIGQGIYKA
ncbi:ABC transporter permease [Mesorhizobium sp. M1A.F.Ca.IN.020.03.2.1]|nr:MULTISPECIES: ABC transporter permease [unclassified Mesorhizobium]RUV02467.1 ABC transporter permease [Mesorhizobium sp. M1A.F.Ca.IN.020.03.2.1]RUV20552.1 ABC transporter permease [Mesorhizobium sp. M1A.F.Ca.IN.022.04.1.1]RWB25734.1 MAG: ABC transporter permease [Mesorhizobium sp.]RWD09641.1 MAG: ABC transporter permease [Mesorhizobium sp.]RWF88738.1 MAG: ABC transporter permease [Mesorhizobium sp.]